MGNLVLPKFGIPFSGKMSKLKDRWSVSEVSSQYAPSTAKSTAISRQVWTAVQMYSDNYTAKPYFIGKKKNSCVVEMQDSEGATYVVQATQVSGTAPISFNVSYIEGDPAAPILSSKAYVIANGVSQGHIGTALLVAMMPFILADAEAENAYNALLPYVKEDENSSVWDDATICEAFSKMLALFGDNIYRRIALNAGEAGALTIPATSSSLRSFSLSTLKNHCELIAGAPYYFSNVGGATGNTAQVNAQLSEEERKLYSLGNTYTEDEKLMIPELPAGYDLDDFTTEFVFRLNASRKYSEPICCAYFVGPGGSGKTSKVRAVANLRQQPYAYKGCSPDMELGDFLGHIYLRGNSNVVIPTFDEVRKRMELPDVQECVMDVESAFIKVFHRKYDGCSENDVIAEVINRVNGEIAQILRDAKCDYTYVEGDFVKALRNGWVFEVQEIGIVRRPGVAVGLNALTEAGLHKYVTLPTGERIERHPDTVIIFTSNDEYRGTENLNQSVLDRFTEVHYFDNPSTEALVARTLCVVKDFPNKTLLKKMANTIGEISQYCKDNDIDTGVCGQRSLTAWAMAIMLEKERLGESTVTDDIVRRTCQFTVLNKVAQNREDIASVAYAIVNPVYGEAPLTV